MERVVPVTKGINSRWIILIVLLSSGCGVALAYSQSISSSVNVSQQEEDKQEEDKQEEAKQEKDKQEKEGGEQEKDESPEAAAKRLQEEAEAKQKEAEEEAEAKRKEAEEKAIARALLLRQRDETKLRTTWNRPACVAGHRQCVDCHKQEVKAWLNSKHSARAFDLLRTSDNALEYAKKLEIRPIDITKSSLCINCHGTARVKINGRPEIFSGVSCESCHSSSLGKEGWLNIHAVYGTAHTLREHESPEHYAFRQQKCDEAGHLRSSDLYGMTKRCFECHIVGDEALSKAGHSHGGNFEMVAKSFGEIRHNFTLDENKNAKVASLWTDPQRHGQQRNAEGRIRVMFLLGQMVDLEMSFRGLARATDENDFSDAMVGRIEEAFELLAEDVVEEIESIDIEEAEEAAEKLKEEQEAAEAKLKEAKAEAKAKQEKENGLDRPEEDTGDEDEEMEDDEDDEEEEEIKAKFRAELVEIKSIVEIVAPIWEKIDDDGFDADDASEYIKTADAIAVVARQFSRRNGNQLEVFDQLELLPEDFFEGAYDPNVNSKK